MVFLGKFHDWREEEKVGSAPQPLLLYMADAIVSFALEKLAHVLGQQLALFADATDELRRLQKTFQHIKAVLLDAEGKQITQESVRLWLLELRQVAYDIDDLLDEGLISGFQNNGSNDNDDGDARSRTCCPVAAPACLLSLYNKSDQIVSRYNFACDIKEIRKRLDEIAKDKEQFNAIQMSSFSGDAKPVRRSRTLTTSLMNEEMIGRADDKDAVINRLVSESSHADDGKQLQVIAILGIGGLGKTTLARKIYHDGKVRGYFQCLYWVCVSEDFDMKRLLKAIIEQVTEEGTSLSELDSLQKELAGALRGKHFLLILDDVWNDDKRKWNMLQPCLSSGAPGSRILVTTRLQKVATNTMSAAYIHELKGLSDDHSWKLFSSIAFDGRTEEEYSQLESVGRKIVSKCKGVPLSITVMGSVMNSKRMVEDWQSILDSKMWSLPEAENKILPALWLSYYNLPPHLKQCFVYCSVYPKDKMMHRDDLVGLWIAQGFVQSQGKREIEDIGAEYVDDLVAWSMLQQEGQFGGAIYTMHDLLHDLAEFICKDEIHSFSFSEVGMSDQCSMNNVRHAQFYFKYTCDKSIIIPTNFFREKKLRTLMINNAYKENTITFDLFHQVRFLRALVFCSGIWFFPETVCKLKHLRHLDLSNAQIVELPNAIGKMRQLRFLKLSYSSIVVLPESISNLCNLHTLNLTNCRELKRLPSGMDGMISLRYLEIAGTYSLEYLPKGLGRLRCLRSLCKFIVGGGCGIEELQQLNSLQESLYIEHLERVSSQEEAEKAELWNKLKLCRLVLHMSNYSGIGRKMDVLEGLRPHVNLEMLELKCYNHSSNLRLPNWMEDSAFSKLTQLKIAGFPKYCEPKCFPGIGKLPALKFLEVTDVGIRKLGYEFYYGSSSSCDVFSRTAFPKLKELSLSRLNELEEWEFLTTTEGDDALMVIMPSLCVLKLAHCPKLEGLPHHLVNAPLESLVIDACDRIKGRGCSFCFPFLEEFTLRDSSEFFSGGLPTLSNLRTFEISIFRNGRLPDGGWEQLVALQKLQIKDCFELKSLPDGLTQLESLEDLEISCCFKLESLPQGLGQLKKLRVLKISDLESLMCLPDLEGDLKSLEHLCIFSLEKLESLPHWLGQLKALNHLQLSYCPLLSERCGKEGLDWPKISHIPNIKINGQKIQGCESPRGSESPVVQTEQLCTFL